MGIFIHEVSSLKKVATLLFKCIFYSWKMKVISYTDPFGNPHQHYHLSLPPKKLYIRLC